MKKLLNSVFAFIIILSMSTSMAFADVKSDDVLDMVNDANAKIEICVEKAQEKAEGADSEKLDKIIEKLVEKTNSIVDKTAKKAEKRGYTVEFEYYDVQVGDRTVTIDPMTVH